MTNHEKSGNLEAQLRAFREEMDSAISAELAIARSTMAAKALGEVKYDIIDLGLADLQIWQEVNDKRKTTEEILKAVREYGREIDSAAGQFGDKPSAPISEARIQFRNVLNHRAAAIIAERGLAERDRWEREDR